MKNISLASYNRLPTTLSIIRTFKCTAACTNCCFECTPKRNETLKTEDVTRQINYICEHFPSIHTIVITGGETLIDIDATLEIVRIGKQNGLSTRIVTNGFWANNEKSAMDIISQCKLSGLDEINFSTGDEHQCYVKIENICKGVNAALKHGIRVAINLETSMNSIFSKSSLVKKLSKDKNINVSEVSIINGLWMPFTAEGLCRLPKIERNSFHPVMDRCDNLFTSLTIAPDNHLMACCGLPVKYIPYFDLGYASVEQIKNNYVTQFEDFIKIWLFVEGPYKILSFLENRTNIEIPELRVLSHMCFYCACLLTNKKYIHLAQKYYSEKYASVMMKFYLYNKSHS